MLKLEIPLGNDINMSLINTLGKQVFKKEIRQYQEGMVQNFDLTSFPKGVYLLELKNANELYSEKIIVR